jgi:hypothetical protein
MKQFGVAVCLLLTSAMAKGVILNDLGDSNHVAHDRLTALEQIEESENLGNPDLTIEPLKKKVHPKSKVSVTYKVSDTTAAV